MSGASDRGKPAEPDPLSSTLRHVKAVQDGHDRDLSWANLHSKIQHWVEEAAYRQNLPADRSLDDLAQEVLMTVCRDIGEFKVEPDASFSGWVRLLTQRKLTDMWRSERAQKRGRGRHRHLSEFDETGGQEHFGDDRTPRQSMLVRFQELTTRMQGALQQMDDKQRGVIEMRMLQGRSYAEIGAALGYQNEATVRSLYMRAMQRLQGLLAAFAD